MKKTSITSRENPAVSAVSFGVAVFAAVLAIAAFLIFKSEQLHKQQEYERAVYILNDRAQRIQYTIEARLSNTYTLEALIRQGKGRISSFEEVTSRMLALHPGLLTVALLPNGVLQKIAPLAGHEAAIGYDQFADPARLRDAVLSVKGLTLIGPVTLPQGEQAAIGQLPVYLDEAGKPKFWGFVAVTLKFPDVLVSTRIDNLASLGYAYELWRIKPEDGQKQRIMGSEIRVGSNALQKTIELPYATWNLSIEPTDERAGLSGLWWKVLIGLLISSLSGVLAKFLIDSTRYKRLLELMAFTDTVTGLPNRRLLLDRLDRNLAQIQRSGGALALAFIDLDGFKGINDKYGHEVGDEVLRAVARRMKRVLREVDTLARIGGDEFVVVMQGLDEPAGDMLMNRLLAAIRSSIQVGELTLKVSGSVGLVFHRSHEKTRADELLRRADLTMYQAKQAGKNRYQVFGESFNV